MIDKDSLYWFSLTRHFYNFLGLELARFYLSSESGSDRSIQLEWTEATHPCEEVTENLIVSCLEIQLFHTCPINPSVRVSSSAEVLKLQNIDCCLTLGSDPEVRRMNGSAAWIPAFLSRSHSRFRLSAFSKSTLIPECCRESIHWWIFKEFSKFLILLKYKCKGIL